MSEKTPRKPVLIDVEAEGLDAAPSPEDAPPPPDAAVPAPSKATQAAARPRSWLGRMIWGAAAGILSLAIGVAAWDFAVGLMERSPWLGWLAWGLLAVIALSLLTFAARELAAIGRMRRVTAIREAAEAAQAETGSRKQAEIAMGLLDGLYAGREDLAWSRTRLAESRIDAVDGDALIMLAEREYMTPLDERASDAVRRASRQVAAATALAPVALIDVLAALTLNLRMLREVAEIYGGRAGWLGSWRLFRAVAAHLIATGALAIGDDLAGPILGGGAVARLSRRFGEGIVNGALTARVGVAAMEVSRPLPFNSLDKPTARGLALTALKGFASKDGD